MKNEGDIAKVTSGLWALTEWYPALRKKMGPVPPSPPAHARPGPEPDEAPEADEDEK